MKAFPADRLDFKPHERSRSALELMKGFVAEELVNVQALNGKIDFSTIYEGLPSDVAGIIAKLEKNHSYSVEKIKLSGEEDLGKTVDFVGMPRKVIDVMWDMLLDSIHHRGQFSVYIRMAGGKVPSIYGPSADEPWDAK